MSARFDSHRGDGLDELAHYRQNATSHDPVYDAAVASERFKEYSDDYDHKVLAEIEDSCVLVDFQYLVAVHLDVRGNLQRGSRKSNKSLDGYGSRRNLRLVKLCGYCGKQYHPSQNNEKKSEFCSIPCRGAHQVKDACVHGHAYTPENTYCKGNKKECRTCKRERSRARKQAARMPRLVGGAA